MRLGTWSVLLALAIACMPRSWAQGTDAFVTAGHGELTLNGTPFRFGGGNSYVLMFSPQAAVDQILETIAANHLAVVRMWAFDDVASSASASFTFRISAAEVPNIMTGLMAWQTWITPSTKPVNSGSSSSSRL